MMQTKYPQKPGLDFILKQAFFTGIKHWFIS